MDLPPRCFECCLAEVQPSRINYPDGIWPNAAVNVLKDLTNDQEVNAEVIIIYLDNYLSVLNYINVRLIYCFVCLDILHCEWRYKCFYSFDSFISRYK